MNTCNIKFSEGEKKFLDDLSEYIGRYKDTKSSLKAISKGAGVHVKTITRWITGEKKPSREPLCNVYIYMNSICSMEEFKEVIPDFVLRDFNIDDSFMMNLKYSVDVESFLKLIRSNTVAREIFYLIKKSKLKIGKTRIELDYSRYGSETLERMIETGVVVDNEGLLDLHSLARDSKLLNDEISRDLILNADVLLGSDVDRSGLFGFYSKEGRGKVLKVLTNAIAEIRSIEKDASNIGDILVSLNILSAEDKRNCSGSLIH